MPLVYSTIAPGDRLFRHLDIVGVGDRMIRPPLFVGVRFRFAGRRRGDDIHEGLAEIAAGDDRRARRRVGMRIGTAEAGEAQIS